MRAYPFGYWFTVFSAVFILVIVPVVFMISLYRPQWFSLSTKDTARKWTRWQFYACMVVICGLLLGISHLLAPTEEEIEHYIQEISKLGVDVEFKD